MSWLHAPVYLLRALAAELPRLEAAESLRRATEIALGTGSLQKEEARQIQRSWLRAAELPTTRRPSTPAEIEAFFAASGVPIIKVPRKP